MVDLSLADLPAKMAVEPPDKKVKGVVTPGWTLNSRYVMLHFFFNVLKEKAPRNQKKGTLPSIDAEALEKMDSPLAERLGQWRSDKTELASLAGAVKFCQPADSFTALTTLPASRTGVKAVYRFATVGFDNVERAFTMPKLSIPLNLSKLGRMAFITPEPSVLWDTCSPENQALLEQLF